MRPSLLIAPHPASICSARTPAATGRPIAAGARAAVSLSLAPLLSLLAAPGASQAPSVPPPTPLEPAALIMKIAPGPATAVALPILVAIDPRTGRLVSPGDAAWASLPPATPVYVSPLNWSHGGLVEEPLRGGGAFVELHGRFSSVTTLGRDASGRFVLVHLPVLPAALVPTAAGAAAEPEDEP